MPLRSCKLKRNPRADGRQQPSIFVFAPSFSQTMKLRDQLAEFKESLVGMSVYPPELILPDENARLDEFLYGNFSPYFEAIAELLNLKVHPSEIESASRHEFFVCTAPIPHWSNANEVVPGLSGLEQLMGYEYPSGGSVIPTPSRSRDDDAHLMAALVLNFPNSGLELADRYDVNFLSQILQEAAVLSGSEEVNQSVGGGSPTSLAPLVKDEDFEQAKPDIANRLQDLGVTLPEDF